MFIRRSGPVIASKPVAKTIMSSAYSPSLVRSPRGVTRSIGCARPNAAIAAIKISQKAVAYQDHPEGDKRCEKCAQFQPPNGCKMVDGTINPQGYCRIF